MLTDTQARPSSMALAFYLATIERPNHRLCRSIGSAIERNRGLVKERAVNANVSYRTAQKLKQSGAL